MGYQAPVEVFVKIIKDRRQVPGIELSFEYVSVVLELDDQQTLYFYVTDTGVLLLRGEKQLSSF